MGATSVTGVGRGTNERGSEHMTLGISHLIGPRMDEEKAKIMETHRSLIATYAKLVNIHSQIIEKFIIEK